ncbi:hypothetical protein M407DRAFT_29081 [Tulasnella calospora MUT 4182]|uniref:Uncharacterized protein n=1 Tax=Tulasnella calospora MUT 4182 TaxID=1051891 RepID=A0A0C3Q9L3_9AGAM|nr:hypothetical protein M407DRAFT_29081 [Tulasnella calospora MUT 4182]
MASPAINKGKGRASETDERTPLLANEEGIVDGESSNVSTTADRHPRDGNANPWNRRILVGAILLLSTFFAGALVFAIGAGYHYASWVAHVNPEQLVKQGVVLKGPSNVEVVNVAEDHIELKVEGAVGIDADWIMGLEREGGGLFGGARKSFGRWLVKRVDQVTVSLGQVELYAPYSRSQHRIPTDPLVSLRASPVTIPLTTRRGDFDAVDDSWLTPISVPVFLAPNKNGSFIGEYAEEALKVRRLLATARVDWVKVDAGDARHWWKPWSLFEVKKTSVERVLRYDFPSSKPSGPGSDDPIGSMVTLANYTLSSNPNTSKLEVSALVDVVNPLPHSIHGAVQSPFEFTISLVAEAQIPAPPPSNDTTPAIPLSAPVARVFTDPIHFTHPNISLFLNGTILPIGKESLPLLSQFLSNYLTARPSPIEISTSAPLSLSIRTKFPAPKEKPKLIRTVKLDNVRIYPNPETGEDLLAAGIIRAYLELPPGLESLTLDVDRILPDVLVYDGPAPPRQGSSEFASLWQGGSVDASIVATNDSGRVPFPAPPLPDPLPPKAFARIRPLHWLDAVNLPAPDPSDPNKTVLMVRAEMEDVPLDILPGRDAVFQQFVQKILWKGFAVAGVRGDAACGVGIEGISIGNGTDMELRGLPVEAQFTAKGWHFDAKIAELSDD